MLRAVICCTLLLLGQCLTWPALAAALPPEKVTLQLKWLHSFQFAGFYAAEEKGYYADEGLDVTLLERVPGTDITTQVTEGNAQYGVHDSGLLLERLRGKPVVAIASIFQHNPLVFISLRSSGIVSPYEIVGKRVMIDTNNNAPLTAMLVGAGINADQYTEIPHSFNYDDLLAGKVDAVSAYITNEPFVLTQKGVEFNVINPLNYGIDFPGDLLFTTESEIAAHPERVEKMRRATLRGWAYALDHPDEMIRLIQTKYVSRVAPRSVEHLHYEAREMRKLILPELIPLGTIDSKRFEGLLQVYQRIGLADKKSSLAGFILTKEPQTALQLTEAEQSWLKAHKVLRVGIDRDFAPYEWIDERGRYQGMAAEIMALVARKLGVRLEIVGDRSWQGVLDMAKQGQLDMISFAVRTPERERYLRFTQPVNRVSVAIITAQSTRYLGELERLRGKRVSVVKGYFMEDNLRRDYPDIQLLAVPSVHLALKAVSAGKAEAYVGDTGSANYEIVRSSLAGLQVAGVTSYYSEHRMAAVSSEPELAAILDKALDSIPKEEKEAIVSRWYGLSIEPGIPYQTLALYAGGGLALLLAILYWNWRLRREIGLRRQAEEKLSLAARVFSDAHEGISIMDANGIIVEINPTFCEITGYAREDVIGHTSSVLKSDQHPPEFFDAIWTDLTQLGHWQGEVWNRKKNGELYAELLTISALRDERGNIMHYISLFSDITQIKRQQQTLELMAHYDVLTRLPNRSLFADRFAQAVAHCKREQALLAVCYLDLDGFKEVNDSFGHEAGDRLLVEVAARIKSRLREEDTVSRLGGDEFALLIGDVHSVDQVEQAMARIHAAIAQPYHIDALSITIAASSGVTIFPMDEADPDTLLRHADQAMYQAKLDGRNRFRLFDPTQDQQIQSSRQMLGRLEEALAAGEFCLYYQPKINMKSGEVLGAEALIRWNHPERGLLPPAQFLPVIEGSLFEHVLGTWVVEQALQQLSLWRKAGLDIQVSVNISPHFLQWPDFIRQLKSALAQHPDISASSLELEILESSVMGDLSAVTEIIGACRDRLGVSIALDDFGTGYSSLAHLRHLPASTIKIDQSFVRDMIDDPDDYAIVEGVVGLANAFRRNVVAEGVETREHGLMLLIMGCQVAQGYGVARPMPAGLVEQWAKDFRPFPEWMAYAQAPLSSAHSLSLLKKIEGKQWVSRMVECLQSEQPSGQNWPIMDHHQCHTGRWIAYADREGTFDHDLLRQFERAHEEMHRVGTRLMELYQAGKDGDARAGIPQLRQAYQALEALLERMNGGVIDPSLAEEVL
jgi:diguanylate cyclase (GGDEF)-like protein/PAS domain S-box-containing protein